MNTETKQDKRTKRANNRGAILIAHDGKVFDVPYNGDYRELYKLINCQMVEPVYLRGPLRGLVVWCDEEGKLKPHDVNPTASNLCRYAVGVDYMAGRCVIMDDSGYDCLALDDERRALAHWAIKRANVQAMLDGLKIEATGPHCEIIEI